MDPSERFLAAAVERGLLAPEQARALLARAVAAGRPAWDVVLEAGALDREAAARLWREVGVRPPASAPPGAPRLEVTGELGRGGMGRVLRARDPAIGREVAKKVLLDPTEASPDARARFLHEARVTGQLEHPGIVPVYEVGQERSGEPYFVMKLVRGRSLAAVLEATRADPTHDGGRLPVLLRQFLKVCDAVAYAHARGVLHRDLKPANVMVGDFGEVLVLDWGLARVRGQPDAAGGVGRLPAPGADHAQTQDGELLGTPDYMPPEQAEGRRDAVDERSDVYALGAILFELLTLRPPFVGTTQIHLLKQVLMDAPPDPRAVAPAGRTVPRELAAVALKALARDPAQRYAGAADLAAEVTRFLDGRPVEALPVGAVGRALKWAARHAELTAALTGALVLLLLVGGAAGFALAARAREAARLSDERAAALAAREAAEADARAAERRRLAAAEARARALGPYLRAADLVDRILPDAHVQERVVAPLEEAAREDPSFADAHFKLGVAYVRVGDLRRAEAALREADEVVRASDPRGHARAVYVLARLAELRGDLTAARALLAEVVARDPDEPFAAVAASRLADDPDEALRLADEAVARHPHLGEAHAAYAQGVVALAHRAPRYDLARLEDIEARFTRAIDLHQPVPEVAVVLFDCHVQRATLRLLIARARGGDLDPARADFQRVRALLELNPPLTPRQRALVDHEEAMLYVVARSRGATPAADAARGLLRRAIVTDPTLFPSRLALLELELAEGRPREALEALRALDLALAPPALARALRRREAVAAVEAGQLEVAARALAAARALPPAPRADGYVEVPDLDRRAATALGAVRRWLLERGRSAEVEPVAREALAMAAAKAQQAAACLEEARHEDAVRLADEGLHALDAVEAPDPALRLDLLGLRAQASSRLGRLVDAARDLEAGLAINDRATPELARRAAADACNLAAARALLPGGREAALEALERAAALGWDEPEALRRHPALAPLLDDPRAQAALLRMGGR